jgi:glucokinase
VNEARGRPFADVVIGVDLGGTNVRAAAVRGSEIVRHHARAISSRAPETVVLQEIFEAIDRVHSPEVRGIGCGVPSLVDVEHGIVHKVENIPSWREVPLKTLLQQRYAVPAFVNNDANCFALGELRFGKGVRYRNLVALAIGTGLGAGLILDGRLYSGANCGAGEVGSMPFRDRTLEYYCSGQRLVREHGVAGELLCQRAEEGDAAALAAFEALGTDLGDAVIMLLCAYDPEIIVFGGSVSAALPFFLPALLRQLSRFPQPHVVERLVITRSERPEIALLGAAALCLERLTAQSAAFQPGR